MYYQHFRLTGPPFEAAAGSEAIYLSRAHRESLAALEWGLLHEPNGFTTLTGETGTGKTTLVCSILARNFSQLCAAYVINPKLSFEDILRVVLGQFGVQCTGATKLDRIEALIGFLGRRMPQERLAIIVDEAQDLSDDVLEELRLLSNYGQRIGRYLQLVLVGQPELALRLKNLSLRQFNQRVAARSVLSRLSFAEAHEYVEYRLRAKGGRSRDIFESDSLVHLLRHSAGIPRQINVLCHNAMLMAYSSGRPQVDRKAARAAVAEYGESLLNDSWTLTSGSWTLTIPPKRAQPIFVGVAALGLLLVAGYSYRGVPGETPRANDGASVTVAQRSEASLKASNKEPKASFKAAAKEVDARVSSPAAAPITQASSKSRPPGISRNLATTSTSSVENVQRGNTAAIELPALLSAQPVTAQDDNNLRQADHVSTLSAASGVDQERSISVKYGDTLEKLALRYLGSRYALNVLIDANPQITNINRIYPGQKIYLSARGHTAASPVSSAHIASRSSASYADDTMRSDDTNGPDARSAGRTDDR